MMEHSKKRSFYSLASDKINITPRAFSIVFFVEDLLYFDLKQFFLDKLAKAYKELPKK